MDKQFEKEANIVISKVREALQIARGFSYREEMMTILLECEEKLTKYRDNIYPKK